MNDDETVLALQLDVEDARKRLRAAQGALAMARIAALPFKVGDVVTVRGEERLVRHIESDDWQNPMIRVAGRKKNGDWSLSCSLDWAWAVDA